MEAWREDWREKIAPKLTAAGLTALRDALLTQDPALIQGRTVLPTGKYDKGHLPIEACCGVGYGVWKGEGLTTLQEVWKRWEEICIPAGKPAVRGFIGYWDRTPLDEIARDLVPEIELALANRPGNN